MLLVAGAAGDLLGLKLDCLAGNKCDESIQSAMQHTKDRNFQNTGQQKGAMTL
jgi:hypothetical protein